MKYEEFIIDYNNIRELFRISEEKIEKIRDLFNKSDFSEIYFYITGSLLGGNFIIVPMLIMY